MTASSLMAKEKTGAHTTSQILFLSLSQSFQIRSLKSRQTPFVVVTAFVDLTLQSQDALILAFQHLKQTWNLRESSTILYQVHSYILHNIVLIQGKQFDWLV